MLSQKRKSANSIRSKYDLSMEEPKFMHSKDIKIKRERILASSMKKIKELSVYKEPLAKFRDSNVGS